MKSLRKMLLAMGIAMAVSGSVWGDGEAEKSTKPSLQSEVKMQVPDLEEIREELIVASEARDRKLAKLSPDFVNAKDEMNKANAAVAKDQQNWRLKKAQNDARQRFVKVRDEELKKLTPDNPDLKSLDDKFAEIQAKFIASMKAQKDKSQNTPDAK